MTYSIEVQGLRKSYGRVPAVKNLSFRTRPGEVFGLLGANGAGKSTTLECVLGTKKQDGGSVRILDLSPAADRKALFQRVGVQFQEANYQEKIRVEELCEVTQALYQAPAEYGPLLRQFGLEGKEKSPIGELSGGQKQRLFIVLALLPAPEVVFLDELTTGLDTKARRGVWKCLAGLKEKGMTILLTSHFMDEVETLCDRIAILRGGEVVFTGTVAEAVAASGCETFEDAYLFYSGDEETEDQDEGIC